jgi:hypothetical protein
VSAVASIEREQLPADFRGQLLRLDRRRDGRAAAHRCVTGVGLRRPLRCGRLFGFRRPPLALVVHGKGYGRRV